MNSRYPLVMFLFLLFTAGCGQKGPLYLPGNPSEIKTDVPRQDSSQNEQAEEEEVDEEKAQEQN